MNIALIKNKLAYGFLIIITFIFIYDPPLNFIPSNLTTLIAIPCSIFLIVRFLLAPEINKTTFAFLWPFLIIVALAVYSYIWSSLNGTNDSQVGRILLIFIFVYLPSCYALVILFKKNGVNNLKALFELIILICFIQSIFVLVMFVNPTFKLIIFSLFRDDRTEINIISGGVRMLGFAYSTVWDLAFLQSISLMLIAFLLNKVKGGATFLYGFYYLVILVSVILSGRTGFIGVFMSLLFFLFIIVSRRKTSLKKLSLFLVYIVVIVITTFIALNALLPQDVKDILDEKVIPWAFEIFINGSETGKLESASSDELKTMYFDVSNSTLFFGDARYVDPIDPTHYYMGTDAGYMRHILFFGITGSFFLWLFYLIIFLKLIKLTARHKQWLLGSFYFMLLIYFFIAHIKGDLFLGGAMPLRLLFLVYIFNSVIKYDTEYGFNNFSNKYAVK